MSNVLTENAGTLKRRTTQPLQRPSPRHDAVPRRKIGGDYLFQQLATALPLVVSDMMGLATAFILAVNVCDWLAFDFSISFVSLFGYLVTGLLAVNAFFRLYPACGWHPVEELRQTVVAVSATCGVFAFAFLARNLGSPFKWMSFFGILWVAGTVAVPLLRSLLRRTLCRDHWWCQPVIVVGTGDQAQMIWNRMRRERHLGLRPIGFVEANGGAQAETVNHRRIDLSCLGTLENLAEIASKYRVFRGVVALNDLDDDQRELAMSHACQVLPRVVFATQSTDLPSLLTTTQCFAGSTGIVVKERLLLPLPRMIKRAMDLAIVLGASIALVPLFAVLAVAVKLSSPGPVFYKQRRLGELNRQFWAWKFRSMVSNADDVLADYLAQNESAQEEWDRDHKLKNDPRITMVGRLLRKTSLDELPQLWNVLRGEMSLVGPRPIVAAEISKYDTTYRLYSRVRPGITGLWQISGRNDTTYAQRVSYDGYYARNWSPWLDVYILCRTVKTVLFCEGAY